MATTPVFLPGESQGQRSLESYSPWGHNVLDMTEATYHAHTLWPLVLGMIASLSFFNSQ